MITKPRRKAPQFGGRRGKERELTREPRDVNEEPSGSLDFKHGDERDGRVGDRRSPEQRRAEFPPARVRQAGMSGG